MIVQMALSPLTPLSQSWERGELDSPPPIRNRFLPVTFGQETECFLVSHVG